MPVDKAVHFRRAIAGSLSVLWMILSGCGEGGPQPAQPATPSAADSGAAAAGGQSPADKAIHRRAVEAVIWGMPAVNFDLMVQAAAANGAKPNQIVY